VVTTAVWPTPTINVADRDYFQDARARTDGQLSTSVPIYNRINGKRTIVFSRRLEGATGNFVGIIYCSVNTEFFEDIYGSIQSVHSHQFTLRKRDGTILVRHPEIQDVSGQKADAGPQWLEAVTNGGGGYSYDGAAGGRVNFVSVRTVPEYPLVVDISVSEQAALGGWNQRAATIGIGSAALLLCSLYLLLAVTRQVRNLSDSEASLAQKSQQLDAALNNMTQALTMFDAQQHLIVCNRQYAELYGLTPEQTKPGTPFHTILEARIANGNVPDDVESFVAGRLENANRPEPSCTVNTLRDGRIISVAHQSMSNGGWVAVHQDITSQKRAEAALARMARYDALTGLANRVLFMDQACAALVRMRAHGSEFAVLMLDLDRFKTVNDSLGHPVGDSLLRVVAQRLRQMIPDVDTVSRLGGDEFAILMPGIANPNAAGRLAESALETLRVTGDVPEISGISSSIGIALCPDDATDRHALLTHADTALYRAKSEGRNTYRFFEANMGSEVRQRRLLEHDLRLAITRNEMRLVYQPQGDIESHTITGFEALLRWEHPARGAVSPTVFIPIAEETGAILEIGHWVLKTACREAASWTQPLTIAVNVSAVQLYHAEFARELHQLLLETGLPPRRLEIEITETALVRDFDRALATLRQIKALGVRIAMDDFGTGYSSLSNLRAFPFDKIKIDGSFIKQVNSNDQAATIVRAVLGLGRGLGLPVLAEGVETDAELKFLQNEQCDEAQGYLLGRPAAIGTFRHLTHDDVAAETADAPRTLAKAG
jgi:diguanylate cyclase (GGDEF)-like protein